MRRRLVVALCMGLATLAPFAAQPAAWAVVAASSWAFNTNSIDTGAGGFNGTDTGAVTHGWASLSAAGGGSTQWANSQASYTTVGAGSFDPNAWAAWSIGGWFQAIACTNSGGGCAVFSNITTAGWMLLVKSDRVGVANSGTPDGGCFVVPSPGITPLDGAPHHIVMSRTGTNALTLYYDGAAKGSCTYVASLRGNLSSLTRFGSPQDTFWGNATFRLQDFRVYSTVLADTDVTGWFGGGASSGSGGAGTGSSGSTCTTTSTGACKVDISNDSGGFFDSLKNKLGDVGSSITGGLSSLGNFIVDGFKSLFLPSDSTKTSWSHMWDSLNSKFPFSVISAGVQLPAQALDAVKSGISSGAPSDCPDQLCAATGEGTLASLADKPAVGIARNVVLFIAVCGFGYGVLRAIGEAVK